MIGTGQTHRIGGEIWRNTRFWRVRLLHWGFWAVAAAFLVAGLAGLTPDPLGLLILAAVMAAIAGGMEVYRGLIVTRLVLDEDGLAADTLGFVGRRSWRLGRDIAVSKEFRFNARGLVSTGVMLRIPGRRLPFILDTTENPFDARSLRRLR
jgi:hypothetical protein